jgi:HlyD family secretion protein
MLMSCQGRKDSRVINASGTIEAVEIAVSAKISGQLESRLVDEGSRVSRGQKLAVVDSSALVIQLQQAEAGVALAEAQLALLLKGARIEDIRQAEEVLTQAKATLRVAEEDRKRILNLFEKNSATTKQKDDAEARYTVARAQHEAAEQALRKLRRLARPEEVSAARARLEQAAAGRDLLKKNIADCTVVSPASGVVIHTAVEPGEFAVSGAPILTLADLDRIHLNIYVTELELGKIRLGQQAEIKIDSHPERIFTGSVVFISPEAEFTPKNIQTREERVKLVYRVKMEVENRENILKPGMPADATIRLGDATAASP